MKHSFKGLVEIALKRACCKYLLARAAGRQVSPGAEVPYED